MKTYSTDRFYAGTFRTHIMLGKKLQRSFEIQPVTDPTLQQKSLLDKWLML